MPYTLHPGPTPYTEQVDLGRECLNVLVDMVYAHRDDLLVVLAGYNESSAMHTPDPSPTHLTPTPQHHFNPTRHHRLPQPPYLPCAVADLF